jgi:hypothetical protein
VIIKFNRAQAQIDVSIKIETWTETTPMLLFFVPSSNWQEADARFAAYFFGDGEAWVSLTDTNGDGVYECAIPSGKNFTNVIFCRMNPSSSINSWGNKWNQTADLPLGQYENEQFYNIFHINEGEWDGAWGYWAQE